MVQHRKAIKQCIMLACCYAISNGKLCQNVVFFTNKKTEQNRNIILFNSWVKCLQYLKEERVQNSLYSVHTYVFIHTVSSLVCMHISIQQIFIEQGNGPAA